MKVFGELLSFHFELVCHCRFLDTFARSSVLSVDVIDVVRGARCFLTERRGVKRNEAFTARSGSS